MQQRHEARAAAQAAELRLGPGGGDGGEVGGESSRPGHKRGAVEGRVATPRGEEAKKREPRGAGGRSAGDGSDTPAGVRAKERPAKFDV
eukprot:967918-Prymnesium_polylepis.1